MSINQPDRDRMPPEFMASLRDYWVFFLIEGIILVALGLAAITIPAVATPRHRPIPGLAVPG